MKTARKELILHIGMGKTGTTALQQAFWDNRKVLSAQGIAYPVTGATSSAHHLITPRVPKFLENNGWTFLTPDEWAPKVAALREPRILMSSELIAWSEPATVESFCAALSTWFDVRVCLYLRRQDNLIMAGYNQQIKAGTQAGSITKLIEKQIDRYDYLQKIWPWEKALGAPQLIVLPYERSQFHDGDLIKDFFMRVLGMPVPAGFTIRADTNPNPRFSLSAMEFKRHVNALMPDVRDSGRFNDALVEFSITEDKNHGAIFQEQDLLSLEQRQQVLRIFEAGNAYIARKFMGREDGILFRETLDTTRAGSAASSGSPELDKVSAFLRDHSPRLFKELKALAESGANAPRPIQREAAKQLTAAFAAPASAGPAKQESSRPEHRTEPTAISAPKITSAPPTKQQPRLLVHFGMHKTGSSSIQQTLYHNADRLGDKHFISFKSPNGSLIVLNGFSRQADISAARRTISRTRLETRIRKAPAQQDLIFSAEAIIHLPKPELGEFVELLRRAHPAPVFLGYVREPVSYVRSAFQQVIKNNLPTSTPFDSSRTLRKNYNETITHLDQLLGRENVHVFPFERDLFPQGDVVRHFLSVAGIDADGLTIHHVNESLSMTAVKALYCYRKLLGNDDRELQSNSTQKVFIEAVGTLPGAPFRLAPEIDARIAAANQHIFDWSEERLGRRLEQPQRSDDEGIRDEAGMMQFSDEELTAISALAVTSDLPGLPAGAGAQDVANVMQALRNQKTGPARSMTKKSSGSSKARLAIAPAKQPEPGTRQSSRGKAGTEVLVHFGIRKTGSSSIQETLYRNRGHLGGADYISFGMANSSLNIRNAFGTDEALPAERRSTARGRFETELRRAASAPRAILSAETISDFGLKEAADLVDTLKGQGTVPSFMGYMRDPVSYVRSAFQETLKNTLVKSLPFAPQSRLDKGYHSIVTHLDQLLGRENVHVFPFERDLFPQGDVVRHFLSVAGIDADGLTIHRVNESLSMTAVKALYCYRKLLVNDDRELQSNSTRKLFIEAVGTLPGAPFRLAPEIDARIAAANQHIFDWSEERLGRRLEQPQRSDDEGIRDEAGMMQFSDEELTAISALAVTSDLPGLPAGAGAQDVANVMQALRNQKTGPARSITTEKLYRAASQPKEFVARFARTTTARKALHVVIERFGSMARRRPIAMLHKAGDPSSGRRILIHPGPPKTATTAIQGAFFRNRARLLAKHGILYPGSEENHTRAVIGMFRHNALSNVRFSGMSEAGLATYRAEVRQQFEQEMCRPGWHTLILSGEGINTLTTAEWNDFISWLQGFATDIRVIFGVRDGIDLVRSMIQQSIKSGIRLEDLYEKPPVFRASERLGRIIASLGRDHITIWDFDAATKDPDGMLSNFCKTMALDPEVCKLIAATPAARNESLSQAGVEALAERNRNLTSRRGINKKELDQFLALKGPRFVLPPEVIDKISAAVAAETAWLHANFPDVARSVRSGG